MPTFATVTPSGHVTLWDENPDGTTSVASHAGAVDPAELPDEVEIWSFDVETSMETRTAFNGAKHPFVDADGRPVWKGARMAFARAYHHVNVDGGTGSVKSFDEWGGVRIVSDRPLRIYGRDHFVENRSETTILVSKFERDPVLGGVHRLSSGVGDPFEHGRTSTFLRVGQDPREACTPVPRSAPKP